MRVHTHPVRPLTVHSELSSRFCTFGYKLYFPCVFCQDPPVDESVCPSWGHRSLSTGGRRPGTGGGDALLPNPQNHTFLAYAHVVTGPKLTALPEPLSRHLVVGDLTGESGTLLLHHLHIHQGPRDLDIAAWGRKEGPAMPGCTELLPTQLAEGHPARAEPRS